MAGPAQNPGGRFAETEVGEHELSALGCRGAEESDSAFMFQREGGEGLVSLLCSRFHGTGKPTMVETNLACRCYAARPGLWAWFAAETAWTRERDVVDMGSYNHDAQSTWTINDVQTDV